MKNKKILSAFGLYLTFLFIGHHGPLSAMSHEYHPLVVLAPGIATEQTVAAKPVSDEPQVLGASTEPQSVLFYNPVENIYESTPSNLNKEQINTLHSCISKLDTFDMNKFEKCYVNIYPRAVLQDHAHTHKKHTMKIVNKEDHAYRSLKMRKFQPHTV